SLKRHRGALTTLFTAALAGASLLCPAAAKAQSRLDVVHAFDATAAFNPRTSLVLGTDGNFYGTASGALGSIFKMTPSGTITQLHAFIGGANDGATVYAGLTLGTDGNFYGTTAAGGTANKGTVFKMSS